MVVANYYKRHERFKHERGCIGMSISCAGHLRAWLIEDVETYLQHQSVSTVYWAEQLAGSLLSGLTVQEIIEEASKFLPEQGFKRFLSWSLRNYPSETLNAVTAIIRRSAHADDEGDIQAYSTLQYGLPYEYNTTASIYTGGAAAQPGPKSGSGSY